MGIEFLGDGTDFLLLDIGGGGEWEGVEATGFRIAWVVANTEPTACAECPNDLKPRAQDTKGIAVVQTDSDKHIVRQNRSIQKLKDTVLSRFDGHYYTM
jgi:hypothetical protein